MKKISLDIIQSVKSSNIELIGFNENTTYVKFKNGTLYSYNKTQKEDFDTLIKAESVGKHFNSQFKNRFEFAKLEDTEIELKKVEKTENELKNTENVNSELKNVVKPAQEA